MRIRAQAWATLILLKGPQDLCRQQVFPRPVNLIEMGSQKKRVEREDTDGRKGRYTLRNRRKGDRVGENSEGEQESHRL